jgi:hypothetical protein
LLRYRNIIWIGNDPELKLQLISAFHDSAVGAHSSVLVTYHRLKQVFAWRGMKLVVHTYVTSCVICQQAKHDRARSPGLLQPLPTPAESWQIITMDFIEGLPQSGNANYIMVIGDKFTKFAHFLPHKHSYTAETVARFFLDNVYKLHGLPEINCFRLR